MATWSSFSWGSMATWALDPIVVAPVSTMDQAVASRVRYPVFTAFVDWDRDGYGSAGTIDDLSDRVVSITIDRRYTTDIPALARLVTGYTVAEATIELI